MAKETQKMTPTTAREIFDGQQYGFNDPCFWDAAIVLAETDGQPSPTAPVFNGDKQVGYVTLFEPILVRGKKRCALVIRSKP